MISHCLLGLVLWLCYVRRRNLMEEVVFVYCRKAESTSACRPCLTAISGRTVAVGGLTVVVDSLLEILSGIIFIWSSLL